jgi:hypothetical protein
MGYVAMQWRVGRRVGRTIYAMWSEEPSDHDVLIGVMDTAELAERVVGVHNGMLGLSEACAQFDGDVSR